VAGVVILSLAASASLAAQAPSKPAAPAAPSVSTLTPVRSWRAIRDRIDADPRGRAWGRPALRIGSSYSLAADDSVRDAVVVFGSATIDGFVDGDLVVIMGDAKLSSTAVVNGAVRVVAGDVSAAPGAMVRDELVLIGGAVTAPTDAFVGGGHVVIGAPSFGESLRAVVPWFTRGLLWGRLIVPSLGWIWWFVIVGFLISLLVNTAFHEPVGASAAILTDRPLGSFLSGLLVMLLMAPITVLLVASVIGVLVLPFILCAFVLAGVIGKAGASRALGASLVPADEPDQRLVALRSFTIGSVVIDVLYMIPLLGLVTWALLGVLGLGSAVLAFFAALRRENPVIKRDAAIPPVPPVPPAPPSPPPSHGGGPIMPEPVMTATTADPNAGSYHEVPPLIGRAGLAGTAAATDADLRAFPHATFGDRLAAFALDLVLLFIVNIWLDGSRHGGGDRFLLYALVYFVIFWAWKSTTVGGIICNLRIVRVDGTPLRPGDAVIRGLTGVLSMAAAGLGGLWILRDPEQQAWHDRIAGTFVVKVPREWPI
jgi:uncharacterized RDD family membrane protein YckC